MLAIANPARAQGGWTVTDLGTLGGLSGNGEDINEAGHVVGGSNTASGDDQAFLWTPSGGMVDLGTLGGSFSVARGLNNAGQVVGSSDRAFLWTEAGVSAAKTSMSQGATSRGRLWPPPTPRSELHACSRAGSSD